MAQVSPDSGRRHLLSLTIQVLGSLGRFNSSQQGYVTFSSIPLNQLLFLSTSELFSLWQKIVALPPSSCPKNIFSFELVQSTQDKSIWLFCLQFYSKTPSMFTYHFVEVWNTDQVWIHHDKLLSGYKIQAQVSVPMSTRKRDEKALHQPLTSTQAKQGILMWLAYNSSSI